MSFVSRSLSMRKKQAKMAFKVLNTVVNQDCLTSLERGIFVT